MRGGLSLPGRPATPRARHWTTWSALRWRAASPTAALAFLSGTRPTLYISLESRQRTPGPTGEAGAARSHLGEAGGPASPPTEDSFAEEKSRK